MTGSDSSLDTQLDNNYHKAAQIFVDNFVTTKKTGNDLLCQSDAENKCQIEDNRQRLVPIVKTFILCGRIGIAYRGHRDDGNLHPEKPIAVADENFRALLAFRIDAGDTILKKHLLITVKNATYISKKNQNELIGICGDVISDQIIAHQSKYFSVLVDETTDSGHQNNFVCA